VSDMPTARVFDAAPDPGVDESGNDAGTVV
jgi:hypothetical protein